MQYFSQRQNESINRLIEEAILEAEEKGARVISLGLLNQVSIYMCVFGRFIPLQNLNYPELINHNGNH